MPMSIYYLRSNQIKVYCQILLKGPKGKMRMTVGYGSLSAAAPYLWNSLLAELRDSHSILNLN